MVHHYILRNQPWKKGMNLKTTHFCFEDDDEEKEGEVMGCDEFYYSASSVYKKTKSKFFVLLFLSFLSCSFIFLPHFFSHFYSFGVENGDLSVSPAAAADDNKEVFSPLCSSILNGTICCDRTSIRSDICIMKGDIRTYSSSSSIFLYTSPDSPIDNEDDKDGVIQVEKVKPYTRKWEKNTMDTVDELKLIVKRKSNVVDRHHRCNIRHDVPAVFFSTGGYTGNVYHEFNDGILPLYITSQHLKKEVVFVILEYHNWWITKYGDILSQLSNYPPIDFRKNNKTHCFPQVIAGLRIHDELSVDSSLMEGKTSIVDFRNLLDTAYRSRIQELIQNEEKEGKEEVKMPSQIEQRGSRYGDEAKRPKMVVLSRKGSRAITNEKLMVKMAERVGFEVKVLRPDKTTELAKIYRELNESDVMVGVHGAAMTHFLFMRPNTIFIQIVPLGTAWAAETYYGEPAKKLGLKYIGYEIRPKESSLYNKYDKEDPVLVNPDSITKKGWEYTKKIYLDGQNVRLNLSRFQKQMDRAYYYCIARTRHRGRAE